MSSNVIALPTAPATRPVAPIEAKWIRHAEIDTAEHARTWAGRASSLRAQVNRLDHAFRDTLGQYAFMHRQHREKDFAGFHPKYPRGLYWPLLGLAALLETPLNNSALGLLNMDQAETWMVAASIGVLNVLGASFVGAKVRQSAGGMAGLRDWILVGLVLAIALGVMLGLAGLRMDDLAMKVSQAGIAGSAWNFAAFVGLQLLFFVVGVVFTYNMHSPDAELERLLKDKGRLRRQLEGIWKERAALASRHDQALGEVRAGITKVREDCLAKMAEYRDHNMRSRSTPAPSWMHRELDHAVFVPLDLGTPLDREPPSIDQLITTAEESHRV